MIYITGKMNGEQERFFDDDTIRNLTAEDYLIICGGFEFIMYDGNTIAGIVENAFLDELETMPYTVLFVDGVNENFDLLNAYPVEMWNGGKIHRIRKNIAHLMRGQIFVIEGKKIFTMGGGRPGRLDDYVSEMKNETSPAMPTKTELEEGWENLRKHNFNVDMIITYTSTGKAIAGNTIHKDRTLYAGDLLPFFERLIEEVSYKKWYFGLTNTDVSQGFEQSPSGQYCKEKKMCPVWLKVLKFEFEE